MFGLFTKKQQPVMSKEEFDARYWLALRDKDEVNAVAIAIRQVVGTKLSAEDCLKCAMGARVQWLKEQATGRRSTEAVEEFVRGLASSLSEVECREVVRIATTGRTRSRDEAIARMKVLSATRTPSSAARVAATPARQVSSDGDTIFVDAAAAERGVLLKSSAGEMTTNLALLIVVLLGARKSGWTGGESLFRRIGDLESVADFKEATLPGRDARALRLELAPLLERLSGEEAEALALNEFVRVLDGSDLQICVDVAS